MHLTKKEEKLLEGEEGKATKKAMELLVRLGDIYGAEEMVEIGSAQASGISYKSIGDPGLQFLQGFADEGAKVKVPTYANPAGMDLEKHKKMGIPDDFAKKQNKIVDALEEMGIITAFTCTPYLAGNLPRKNEHIAWAESSAVSFANSVIQAKTNREGGPSALSAAITGRTPKYGLHLEENRKPTRLVKVKTKLKTVFDFGALGSFIGEKVDDGKPFFKGIKQANTDQLKSLGAAMAASGAVALYFVDNITVDGKNYDLDNLETLEFTKKEKRETVDRLNTGTQEPDLIVVGCPHSSINEVKQVAAELEERKLKSDLWVLVSKPIEKLADRMGYTETIEQAGGQVLSDTCHVVCPIQDLGYETTGVNSGKAAEYLPGFGDQNVIFASVEELIERYTEKKGEE